MDAVYKIPVLDSNAEEYFSSTIQKTTPGRPGVSPENDHPARGSTPGEGSDSAVSLSK